MALRKSRDGTWIVDVSNGINPISLKQRRIVRKGFKTKKEALEAELSNLKKKVSTQKYQLISFMIS